MVAPGKSASFFVINPDVSICILRRSCAKETLEYRKTNTTIIYEDLLIFKLNNFVVKVTIILMSYCALAIF